MGLNVWMCLTSYTNEARNINKIFLYKHGIHKYGQENSSIVFILIPVTFFRNFLDHVFVDNVYGQLLRHTTSIDTTFFHHVFIPYVAVHPTLSFGFVPTTCKATTVIHDHTLLF